MINRSRIKHSLRKILPRSLFSLVVTFWREKLLPIVTSVDEKRLEKFTTYHTKELRYKGHTFTLYLSPSNGFIDKHIFLYGIYEPYMLDVFLKYLNPGMTFVDIGANIGQHSLFASSVVGETGSVHSFEPVPSLYRQIHDSVHVNGWEDRVHVHPYALGEEEKQEQFFVSANAGGSSLVNDDETKEILTVEVKRGDVALSSIEKIDMIKIDVEGYEYEVLKGIRTTLITHRPIVVFEFSANFYASMHNNHGIKILTLLRDLGYELYDIEDNLTRITNDEAFEHAISTVRVQTNLLCLPKK
jgi:FkbM family methyltransferase